MDPQIETALVGQGGIDLGDYLPHPGEPDKERLPSMQDNLDIPQIVPGDMLGDALGGLRDHFFRHCSGLVPPALVRTFIHIAMITGQIASAMNLDYELTQRNQ